MTSKSTNSAIKEEHKKFCKNCLQVKKRIFLVTVLQQHPHFTDTGADIEVLSSDNLIRAYNFQDCQEIAFEKFVPANVDPSLISLQIEPLYPEIK